MLNSNVDRVKGTFDVLSAEYRMKEQISNTLTHSFELFGYQPIEVPIIEHTDLYLRKSGEDIVSRLYDFEYRNRRLCLRPELTASVVRAYIDHYQEHSLPTRLYYSGPVFRYEKPQRGRYRQFTQIGIELFGAKETLADAEVIYSACHSLEALGINEYSVVIGHVGILLEFLRNLGLNKHLQSILLGKLEILRKSADKTVLLNYLHQLYPDFKLKEESESELVSEGIGAQIEVETTYDEKTIDIFSHLSKEDARDSFYRLLSSMNLSLNGNREADDIVDRLLSKVGGRHEPPRIKQAIDFMVELSSLRGQPLEVFTNVQCLLEKYDVNQDSLNQLRTLIETLSNYGLDLSKVRIDLGLSRGLRYYTGMIFEIYHDPYDGQSQKQICGGGRYDDLVYTLGCRQEIPAVGFAFGLERIYECLKETKMESLLVPVHRIDALVISVQSEDRPYALRMVARLRDAGLSVETDVRDRSVKSNLQQAAKNRIPFSIIIGEQERISSTVVLRDMFSQNQKTTDVDTAIEIILQGRNNA